MKHTKQELIAAMNALILAEDPRKMTDALDRAEAVSKAIPIELVGEMAVLNPLLELALTDTKQLAIVRGAIDQRREAAGMEPCWPVETKKFDRVANQRRIMQLRRLRAGRAVTIENMQRSERDKIVGLDRLEFERRTLKAWGDRIRAALDAARSEKGARLSRDQQDALRERLWDELDAELDEKESRVRAELLKPPHLRQKV